MRAPAREGQNQDKTRTLFKNLELPRHHWPGHRSTTLLPRFSKFLRGPRCPIPSRRFESWTLNTQRINIQS
jgi:hypothetical protein